MKNKYFGTDGIRGRVGDSPVTADFMLRLGRAAGKVLADGDSRSVVIGKDTRISGYMFESALEAGLAAAGANVAMLGPMPTPAIAYLTRTLHACAGIVISVLTPPRYLRARLFACTPTIAYPRSTSPKSRLPAAARRKAWR